MTEALELKVNSDEDKPQAKPPFKLLNRKLVYEYNKDKSRFMNLHLFYGHFPKGINITGIVIFSRLMVNGPPRYTALVYTMGLTFIQMRKYSHILIRNQL